MVKQLIKILAVAILSAGCAQESNTFPALSSTGELQSDGAGECGAVAISATRAITAKHCIEGGAVFYHAPGEIEGRRITRSWLGKQDIACLEVETGEVGSEIGQLYVDSDIVLESNISGVVSGKSSSKFTDGWIVTLFSQQGESGSAVRDVESGAIAGLVSAGVNAVNGKAEYTKLVSAELASSLCE